MREPVDLLPEHHSAAARVFADAFLHDPGWCAVGPRRERARWTYIYRTCLGTMRAGERWCGPSWCVLGDDGEPIAVLTGCAPGRWPPPTLPLLAYLAPGSLLAGPGVLARGLRAERIFERMHPQHPHLLVWMFSVSPAHQRRGLGRVLMSRALAEADAAEEPAYLWTAEPGQPALLRLVRLRGVRRGSHPRRGAELVHGATGTVGLTSAVGSPRNSGLPSATRLGGRWCVTALLRCARPVALAGTARPESSYRPAPGAHGDTQAGR